MIIIGLFSVIALAVLIERMVYMVVKPVKKLTNVITSMTEGDFTVEIDVRNRDEIGMMSRGVETILTGESGHSATVGRTRGVKKTLNDSGKQINYVFEDTGVWDTGKAKELMQILLKTGVPVDCVLCNNDSMALGVVEACKEAGIDLSAVPVLGVDATAEGCAAIEAGEMAFTVYQSGTGQGEAAIEYALRIANGQSVKDVEGITEDGLYVWVPFVKVESTNVSSYK